MTREDIDREIGLAIKHYVIGIKHLQKAAEGIDELCEDKVAKFYHRGSVHAAASRTFTEFRTLKILRSMIQEDMKKQEGKSDA